MAVVILGDACVSLIQHHDERVEVRRLEGDGEFGADVQVDSVDVCQRVVDAAEQLARRAVVTCQFGAEGAVAWMVFDRATPRGDRKRQEQSQRERVAWP